jgi:cysteine-rich repeat protein
MFQRLTIIAFFTSTACTLSAGGGDGNVEPPAAVCGNNVVEQGEACDDGNPRNGDGCSKLCVIEERAICGDGKIDDGEECDDGNREDGDGCNRACFDESLLNCGNREMNEGEECDDGNRDNGDGCDDHCQAEGEACGNSFRSPGGGETIAEECDDGNADDGDGCSSSCVCEEFETDVANDSDSAQPLTLGGEGIAETFSCGDVDMWSITALETGIYRLYTEGESDPVCVIEDADNTVLAGNDDVERGNLNCSVAYGFQAGQTYFIKTRHYNAESGTGAYTLLNERLADDDHGDTTETATLIETLPNESAGRFDWGVDKDFFSVTATSTGIMTMMTEGEIDPFCTIFDAEGQMLAENDDIDADSQNYNCRIDQQVEAGQMLFLSVAPFTSEQNPSGAVGDYTLIVRQGE